MLKRFWFKFSQIPTIQEVKENVEIAALDQGHVVPNMEPWIFRRVWFPKGYPEPISN